MLTILNRAIGGLERQNPSVLGERTDLLVYPDDLRAAYAGAVAARKALEKAERFIVGFEGDELQEGIGELLAELRAARVRIGGKA